MLNILVEELVQISSASLGFVLALWWLFDGVLNLRRMYRAKVNGIMEQQAWEHLGEAALLLLIQSMWLATGLRQHLHHAETPEAQQLEYLLAVRGTVGSVLVTILIAWKRWSWTRVRRLYWKDHNRRQQQFERRNS